MAQNFQLRMVKITQITDGYARICTHATIHQLPPPPAPQDVIPAPVTTWTAADHLAGDLLLVQYGTPNVQYPIFVEWQVTAL